MNKPRKLTRVEIRQRFTLECIIDPNTREVRVPQTWRRANLRPLMLRAGLPPAWVHKDALPVFARWLARASEQGLLDRIETNDGGFVPRLIRGSKLVGLGGLSLHSYGIALDINAKWNARGTRGAKLSDLGCLLELVPLAYEAGLVWGGDWKGASCDPMHFELGVPCVITTPSAAGQGMTR